jgi:putative mRNA 3-end processing factor
LVERGGERWIFSGDYKVENDGVSEPFEPLRCHVFISECTFGLPVFQWQPQQQVLAELHSWWDENSSAGISSVVCAYSLGKAQRIIRHLTPNGRPVVVHSAIARMNAALGISLPREVTEDTGERLAGALVIAPPAVLGSSWLRRFGEHRCAVASGWMSIRGLRRRRGVDRGFVLSDHADFSGLSSAVRATGAERVLLTHGYTAHFARWLREQGHDARELDAPYNAQGEAEDLS